MSESRRIPYRREGLFGRTVKQLVAGSLALAMSAQPLLAAPIGGQITAGQGAINQNGNTTTITQFGNKVIINWQSFNIGSGETVQFVQPNALAVALNRVTGIDPSVILGSLLSNGQIFLVNPNGVIFGKGATVDVGSLGVSTLSLSDKCFLNGNYNFSQDLSKNLAFIVNDATIKAHDGGYVLLVAPLVNNQGTIVANLGSVSLAAGTAAKVNLDPDGMVNVQLAPPAGAPGNVVMPCSAVSNVLSQIVNTKGIVAAGEVLQTANSVTLVGASGLAVNEGTIQANGAAGKTAGSIFVTGTQATVLTPGSTLTANGVGACSTGGHIKVFSDGISVFDKDASMSAQGGSTGNGGLIELSGTRIHDDGCVNTSAPNGQAGTFLIDPATLNVVDCGGTNNVTFSGSPCATNCATGCSVTVGTIQSQSVNTNILLTATCRINLKNTIPISIKGCHSIKLCQTGSGGIVGCGHGGICTGAGNITIHGSAVNVFCYPLTTASGTVCVKATTGLVDLGSVSSTSGNLNVRSCGCIVQLQGGSTMHIGTGTMCVHAASGIVNGSRICASAISLTTASGAISQSGTGLLKAGTITLCAGGLTGGSNTSIGASGTPLQVCTGSLSASVCNTIHSAAKIFINDSLTDPATLRLVGDQGCLVFTAPGGYNVDFTGLCCGTNQNSLTASVTTPSTVSIQPRFGSINIKGCFNAPGSNVTIIAGPGCGLSGCSNVHISNFGGTITASTLSLSAPQGVGAPGSGIKTSTSSLSVSAGTCIGISNSGSALTVRKAVGSGAVCITNNNAITVASPTGACATVKGTSVCIEEASSCNLATVTVNSGLSSCTPAIQATTGNVTVRTSNPNPCTCSIVFLNNDSIKAGGTATIISANSILAHTNSQPDIIAPTVSLVAAARCGTTTTGPNGAVGCLCTGPGRGCRFVGPAVSLKTQTCTLSATAANHNGCGICVTNNGAVTISKATSTGTTVANSTGGMTVDAGTCASPTTTGTSIKLQSTGGCVILNNFSVKTAGTACVTALDSIKAATSTSPDVIAGTAQLHAFGICAVHTQASTLCATASSNLKIHNSGTSLTIGHADAGGTVCVSNCGGTLTVASPTGATPTVQGTCVSVTSSGCHVMTVGNGLSASVPTIQATTGNVTLRTNFCVRCANATIFLNNDSVRANVGTATIIASNSMHNCGTTSGCTTTPDIIAPTISLVAAARGGVVTCPGGGNGVIGVKTQTANLSAAAGNNAAGGICVSNLCSTSTLVVHTLTSHGDTHLQNNNSISVCGPVSGVCQPNNGSSIVLLKTTSGNITIAGPTGSTPTIQGISGSTPTGVQLCAAGSVTTNGTGSTTNTIFGSSTATGVCIRAGSNVALDNASVGAGGTANITAGAITQAGGILTASTVLLSATGGIGACGAPIHTAAGTLSASTCAGGVFIDNNTAANATVQQLQSITSGNVCFSQTGGGRATLVNASTGSGSIKLTGSNGLTINGTVSNAGAGDNICVHTTSGTISLGGSSKIQSACGNVSLKTTGNNQICTTAGSCITANQGTALLCAPCGNVFAHGNLTGNQVCILSNRAVGCTIVSGKVTSKTTVTITANGACDFAIVQGGCVRACGSVKITSGPCNSFGSGVEGGGKVTSNNGNICLIGLCKGGHVTVCNGTLSANHGTITLRACGAGGVVASGGQVNANNIIVTAGCSIIQIGAGLLTTTGCGTVKLTGGSIGTCAAKLATSTNKICARGSGMFVSDTVDPTSLQLVTGNSCIRVVAPCSYSVSYASGTAVVTATAVKPTCIGLTVQCSNIKVGNISLTGHGCSAIALSASNNSILACGSNTIATCRVALFSHGNMTVGNVSAGTCLNLTSSTGTVALTCGSQVKGGTAVSVLANQGITQGAALSGPSVSLTTSNGSICQVGSGLITTKSLTASAPAGSIDPLQAAASTLSASAACTVSIHNTLTSGCVVVKNLTSTNGSVCFTQSGGASTQLGTVSAKGAAKVNVCGGGLTVTGPVSGSQVSLVDPTSLVLVNGCVTSKGAVCVTAGTTATLSSTGHISAPCGTVTIKACCAKLSGCITAAHLLVTATKTLSQGCSSKIQSNGTCGTGVSLIGSTVCLGGQTTSACSITITGNTVAINRGASVTGKTCLSITSCQTLTNNGTLTAGKTLTLISKSGSIVGSGTENASTGTFCAPAGTIGTPCSPLNNHICTLTASAPQVFLHNSQPLPTCTLACTQNQTNAAVASTLSSVTSATTLSSSISSTSISGGSLGSSAGGTCSLITSGSASSGCSASLSNCGDSSSSSGSSSSTSSSTSSGGCSAGLGGGSTGSGSGGSSSATSPGGGPAPTAPGGLLSTPASASFPAVTPINDPQEKRFNVQFPDAPLDDKPHPSLLPDKKKKNKRSLLRRLFDIRPRDGR
ncbi:MAG: two-partner secretion domain-containing protein [Candidatus Xenobia bacterium]